jgi:hypothetical protein
MSFSLNNFQPTEGTFVQKSLQPGTHQCKVLDLKLEKPPYDPNQYNLVFSLMGPELGGDFEGFQINRLDPSKGTYKGQIGNVKANQYGFKDWEYKGKKIGRDESIQNFLGTFLKQVNLLDQFQGQNVSAETIEDLVAEIRSFLVKGEYTFYFTLGAQKYFKEGSEYPSYALYLPKKLEGKFAYANTLEDTKFAQFNEAVHVYEKKVVDTATDASAPLSQGFAPAADVFGVPTAAPVFEENVNDLQLP